MVDNIKTNIKRQMKEDVISNGDIALIIAKNINFIIFFTMVFSLLTFIYVQFVQTPTYISKSKILSSSSSNNNLQAVGLAAQFGINIPSSQSEPKWVYPEIISSRDLARLVLKRKFDTKEFGGNRRLLEILMDDKKIKKNNQLSIESFGVNKLLKMVKASEDPVTSIVSIQVEAKEPKLAQDLNFAFIEELNNHQKKYNKSKTSNAKQFIIERIKSTEKELASAEEDLKNFRDRNRRIQNSPTLQLKQERLAREVAVLTAVFTTLKQQLETTKIEEVKDSKYVIVLDSPEAPLNFSKPKKLRAVFFAFMFGLGFSIMFVFIVKYGENMPRKEKNKIDKALALFRQNIRLKSGNIL